MKAYTVREDYEGHSCVIFAETGVVARRRGANQLNVDFESVESCKRSPEFDQFAPGPVPVKELIAAGWWFEAMDGGRVDQEDTDPFYPKGSDHVYRSWMGWLDDQVVAAVQRKAEEDAKAACLAAFPFAGNIRAFRRCQPSGGSALACSFTWPGQEHGSATWVIGDSNVYVCAGDKDAWNALRARNYQP